MHDAKQHWHLIVIWDIFNLYIIYNAVRTDVKKRHVVKHHILSKEEKPFHQTVSIINHPGNEEAFVSIFNLLTISHEFLADGDYNAKHIGCR